MSTNQQTIRLPGRHHNYRLQSEALNGRPAVEIELNEVTLGLTGDLKALRAGKITNADARVRAQLAREILRAVHLAMEGMKTIEASQPKRLEG